MLAIIEVLGITCIHRGGMSWGKAAAGVTQDELTADASPWLE